MTPSISPRYFAISAQLSVCSVHARFSDCSQVC
jgi:hypothetical protein